MTTQKRNTNTQTGKTNKQTNLKTAASCDVSTEISPPGTFKSDEKNVDGSVGATVITSCTSMQKNKEDKNNILPSVFFKRYFNAVLGGRASQFKIRSKDSHTCIAALGSFFFFLAGFVCHFLHRDALPREHRGRCSEPSRELWVLKPVL